MTEPASGFDPLHSADQMAGLIAEVTGVPVETAMARLRREHEAPGITVRESFAAAGLALYEWSDGMARFYETTDAFLYELALWNRNRMKSQMRRWIGKRLSVEGKSLEVLCLGDGLGFDCLEFARRGHTVTYCEVPGHSANFARKLFDRTRTQVHFLEDFTAIQAGRYDAVVCLDVLEHVPDVDAVVESIARYLRLGGCAFISAPFFLIHPDFPTHLRSGRKFAGSMSLYRRHGLQLAGGRPNWNPIVLRKSEGKARKVHGLENLAIRANSMALRLGRFTVLPFAPFLVMRRWNNRWFG